MAESFLMPLRFGSLETVKYLLEEQKADIATINPGFNLLEAVAVDDPKNQAKIVYLCRYYREFKDDTTELHVAVLTHDLGTIEENLIKNPNCFIFKNKQNLSPIDYMRQFRKWDAMIFCTEKLGPVVN